MNSADDNNWAAFNKANHLREFFPNYFASSERLLYTRIMQPQIRE